MNATIWSGFAHTANEDFEHCQCPTGFAGVDCSMKAALCRGDQHVCMNGGTVRYVTKLHVFFRWRMLRIESDDRKTWVDLFFASVACSVLSMTNRRMSATVLGLSRMLVRFASTRLPASAIAFIFAPTVERVIQRAN
jgi:hypothetical protein